MSFLQCYLKSVIGFSRYLLLLSMPFIFVACTATQVKQADQQSAEVQAEEQAQAEVEEMPEVEPLPLTPELIYYLTTAEIAGQRGQMGAAVDLYYKASTISESSSIANRSAEIALFSRDQQRINKALKRWAEVEPDDADVHITHAPFLMLQKDYKGVVISVNKALKLAPEKSREYLSRISDDLIELASADLGLYVIESLDLYTERDPEALFAYSRLAAHSKQ